MPSPQPRVALEKIQDAAEIVRQVGYLVAEPYRTFLGAVYDLLSVAVDQLAADIEEAGS